MTEDGGDEQRWRRAFVEQQAILLALQRTSCVRMIARAELRLRTAERFLASEERN